MYALFITHQFLASKRAGLAARVKCQCPIEAFCSTPNYVLTLLICVGFMSTVLTPLSEHALRVALEVLKHAGIDDMDVNARDEDEFTPLQRVIMYPPRRVRVEEQWSTQINAVTHGVPELVARLLAAGAEVNAVHPVRSCVLSCCTLPPAERMCRFWEQQR